MQSLTEQEIAPVAVLNQKRTSIIPRGDEGISKEEKLAELERVIASTDFPATLRNRRFLSFAVERNLDAPAGTYYPCVRAYDVATRIFGRSEDFSTILDPIVRIEAGKLRRDLETYYHACPVLTTTATVG